MRAVASLAAIILAGCSSLLDIQNPTPSTDAAPMGEQLVFNIDDLRTAQNQNVRFHVQRILVNGTREDVTSIAAYRSDNANIATITQGVIRAGMQPGAATITVTLGNAEPARVMVTVTAETCHPVINEVATAGAVSAADEWVELYNPCANAVLVDGWTLVYRSAQATGGTDNALLTTLAGELAPGEIRLYAGDGYGGASDGTWSNGVGLNALNGSVGLRDGAISAGALVDAMAYGSVAAGHPFIERNPVPALGVVRSAARLPYDGNDSGDGADDFSVITTPTPRMLNAP